jgi:S-DNA-T family DNA segregation ATPase FtsK/SpoIIIE
VWTPTGEEVQLAFAGTDPSGGSQLADLRAQAARLSRRWDGLEAARRPRRVDPLPETVSSAELDALRGSARRGGHAVITVGAGGDHLGPVDVDLAELGGGFVIAGPTRSGRSTALLQLARSLAPDLPRVVVTPRPSALRELDALQLSGPGLGAELEAALAGDPVALIVDDAELVDDRSATDVLERFVRGLRDSGSVLLAAATTEDLLLNRYRGWLAAARRERCGLLLNPAGHVDGEVFDLRLPRSTSGGWPPGRGLYVRGATTLAVQVPVATTGDPLTAAG